MYAEVPPSYSIVPYKKFFYVFQDMKDVGKRALKPQILKRIPHRERWLLLRFVMRLTEKFYIFMILQIDPTSPRNTSFIKCSRL